MMTCLLRTTCVFLLKISFFFVWKSPVSLALDDPCLLRSVAPSSFCLICNSTYYEVGNGSCILKNPVKYVQRVLITTAPHLIPLEIFDKTYSNLNTALTTESLISVKYASGDLIFFLLGNAQHTLTPGSEATLTLFERNNVSITIKPWFCSDSSTFEPLGCLKTSQKAEVLLSLKPLSFCVSNSLKISNISFRTDMPKSICYLNTSCPETDTASLQSVSAFINIFPSPWLNSAPAQLEIVDTDFLTIDNGYWGGLVLSFNSYFGGSILLKHVRINNVFSNQGFIRADKYFMPFASIPGFNLERFNATFSKTTRLNLSSIVTIENLTLEDAVEPSASTMKPLFSFTNFNGTFSIISCAIGNFFYPDKSIIIFELLNSTGNNSVENITIFNAQLVTVFSLSKSSLVLKNLNSQGLLNSSLLKAENSVVVIFDFSIFNFSGVSNLYFYRTIAILESFRCLQTNISSSLIIFNYSMVVMRQAFFFNLTSASSNGLIYLIDCNATINNFNLTSLIRSSPFISAVSLTATPVSASFLNIIVKNASMRTFFQWLKAEEVPSQFFVSNNTFLNSNMSIIYNLQSKTLCIQSLRLANLDAYSLVLMYSYHYVYIYDLNFFNLTINRYYAIILSICTRHCITSISLLNISSVTILYNLIYFEGPETLFENFSIVNLTILDDTSPVFDCINRNNLNISAISTLNIKNAMTLFWVEDGYSVLISSVSMDCDNMTTCKCGLVKQEKNTGTVTFKNIKLRRISTLAIPALLYLIGCSWGLCEISFQNFTAIGIANVSKGVLWVQMFSQVFLSDSFFKSISSEESSILKVIDCSELFISFAFIQNIKSQKNGAFFFSDISYLDISNMNTSAVTGFEGGAVYAIRVSHLDMTQSSFSNISTKGEGGVVFSSFSNLDFGDCVFKDVESALRGGVIYLGRGHLKIRNIYARIGKALCGGFLFIREAYIIEMTSVSITGFSVENEGAALFIFQVDSMHLTNFTASNNQAAGNSGNIYLCGLKSGKEIYIKGYFCEKNSISHGSCLLSESNYAIEIQDLYSFDNEGIILKFKSEFNSNITLSNCTFHNFIVRSQEVLSAERVNILLIGRFNITDLTTTHCLLNFINSQARIFDATIYFTNTNKISFNQSFKIICVQDCNMFVKQLNLSKSLADLSLKFSALSVTGGLIIINNSYFGNLLCEATVACLVFSNAIAFISSSSFENNSGLKGGGFYLMNSSLRLSNSRFDSCRSLTQVDKFSGLENPKFPIGAELIFIGDGSDDCSIFIDETYVISAIPKVFSLFFKQLPLLSIMNSKFFCNKNNQGGLMISDCSIVLLINSTFSGFSTSYGAAFKVVVNSPSANCKFTLLRCFFSANYARLGGVGYAFGNVFLNIFKTNFDSNEALVSESAEGGIAGVVYFFSPAPNFSVLNLIDTSFSSNTASFFAPSIFSFAPILISGFFLSNSNTDTINFTDSCSSFPLKIFMSLKDQFFEISNPASDDSPLFKFGSGETLFLFIFLTDQYDKVLKFDNQTRATLLSDKGFIQRGTSQAVEGYIYFKDLQIKAKPNSSIGVQISVDFAPNLPVYLGGDTFRSALSYTVKFFSRPCEIGEIYVAADQTCRKCPKDQYSLLDPMKDIDSILVCNPCPENAICLGGSSIYPKSGYWRFSNMTDIILECKSASSCKGGLDDAGAPLDERGQCAIHHLGNLCYRCELGFARLYARGLCEPCKSNYFLFIKLAITAILLLLFIILQVKLTYSGRMRNSYGILMKQLINHFQQVSLISLTDLAWTQDFKNMFKFQDYFAFLAQEFINLDCFIQDIGSNLLMNKIVATVVIPLFFSFIAFAFWILLFLWQRFFRGRTISVHSLVNRTLLCSLIIIYLLFPELIRMCLMLLDCVRVSEEPRVSLLTFSPDIKCWGSEHLSYIYLAGMPGLIFWGLLTPMAILVLLVKNKNKIKEIILKERSLSMMKETSKIGITITPITVQITAKKADGNQRLSPNQKKPQKKIMYGKNMEVLPTIEEKSSFPEEVIQNNSSIILPNDSPVTRQNQKEELSMGALLKFLYKGYRREYYFWEIVIIFKKFTFLFIANFSDLFPENSKAMILLIALTLFILVQKKFQPFDGAIFNNIEFLSLIIAFLTANFGIMLFSQDLKSISQVFLTFIIALNVLFVILWFSAIYKQFKEARARSRAKTRAE